MWQRFHGLFSKDDRDDSVQDREQLSWPDQPPPRSARDWSNAPIDVRLPRQLTFRRQNSEKRDRLTPVEPCTAERRALSSARPSTSVSVSRRVRANSTPPSYHPARTSAPAVSSQFHHEDPTPPTQISSPPHSLQCLLPEMFTDQGLEAGYRPPRPPSITSSAVSNHHDFAEWDEKALIKAELDTRWILNLSMHFRDKSDREKFFVTYAETPSKWRRVTVSCDYRNAEPGSLEMDLRELQFQRDKSLQIYDSIRDSLAEIQFYDTVTNLKLETSEGRLHVHVTEDVNETIPYPPRSTVAHILQNDARRPKEIRECDLTFDSHLSGFVYKVVHEGRVYIKKEIPGPDTVDEFLYEINALHALHDSENVISLEAIVVDDTEQLVKGLLISYAEQGAIVDLLYDCRGEISLEERMRWGRDAVKGLSDIHAEGYVQGDFTLSNIVVDAESRAQIIDINRRGCPVGWEPPEIAIKIASHQRISMYIGEKTDLYQLGMTLWGLAADDDEPERHDPPLSADDLPVEVPQWYKDIIRSCLDPQPRNRRSARELIAMFPPSNPVTSQPLLNINQHMDFREQKRYINPDDAVEREDIERFRLPHHIDSEPYSPRSSLNDNTYTYPRSSYYNRGSEISEYERPRGRAPPRNLEHLSQRERQGWSTEDVSAQSIDGSEPQILTVSPRVGPQYSKIDLDGKPFLIARNAFSDADLEVLDNEVQNGRPSVRTTEGERSSYALQRNPNRQVSEASAASGSTPRHSTATLVKEEHKQADSGNHTEHNPDQATLSPVPEQRRNSISPQRPPSLSYADSGFHEPDLDEKPSGHSQARFAPVINGADIRSGLRADNTGTSTPAAMTTPKVHDGQFLPRLGRSDTAIRLPVEAHATRAVTDHECRSQPASPPPPPEETSGRVNDTEATITAKDEHVSSLYGKRTLQTASPPNDSTDIGPSNIVRAQQSEPEPA